MNLQAIEAFVHTAELGSFAAVARAKHVAPSSISRLVAELEDGLQVRLFQRTTRRLNLTEAGQAYLDRVAPLLEELERARDEARDLGAKPRGTLRVACAHTFAQLHLTKWLPRLLSEHPELDVELVLDSDYTDLVSAGIDVAVRLGQVQGASLIVRKLCDMPRVVIASPNLVAGRKLAPADMASEPCLLFRHTGFAPVWRFRDRQSRVLEVQPRGRVFTADGVILRDLALAGEGIALLSRWLCARELDSGSLVDLFPSHDVTATQFDAGIFVVYPSRSYLPLKVRVFVDFLSSCVRDDPAWETSAS
ncbi:LysR family transcriptional regulator [Enhygromyxa salina]|uniref:HTH-type transcriptional regulator DmlR n=1 Tax=Enhygromyxa salina TaxID=215803 RepID=A0A2S9YSJ4_9BACT|nr:LysR family transcriptional regulator [Enhygromyxa salina]PRQ08040.1 HTH-type transcriptional regulator DmlR [Enhygromyxa salina]